MILDSGSSTDLFCTPKMLRNFQKASKTVTLGTNAGSISTSTEAELPNYGTVPYDANAIANLFSLANMSDSTQRGRLNRVKREPLVQCRKRSYFECAAKTKAKISTMALRLPNQQVRLSEEPPQVTDAQLKQLKQEKKQQFDRLRIRTKFQLSVKTIAHVMISDQIASLQDEFQKMEQNNNTEDSMAGEKDTVELYEHVKPDTIRQHYMAWRHGKYLTIERLTQYGNCCHCFRSWPIGYMCTCIKPLRARSIRFTTTPGMEDPRRKPALPFELADMFGHQTEVLKDVRMFAPIPSSERGLPASCGLPDDTALPMYVHLETLVRNLHNQFPYSFENFEDCIRRATNLTWNEVEDTVLHLSSLFTQRQWDVIRATREQDAEWHRRDSTPRRSIADLSSDEESDY